MFTAQSEIKYLATKEQLKPCHYKIHLASNTREPRIKIIQWQLYKNIYYKTLKTYKKSPSENSLLISRVDYVKIKIRKIIAKP